MSLSDAYTAADARDTYFDWNRKQFSRLEGYAGAEKLSLIRLLPLLFQLNDRALPGYAGEDIPMGVYGYTPSSDEISAARGVNSKFSFTQQSVIRYPAIDAIFVQHQVLDNRLRCWLFCREDLNLTQLDELLEKIQKTSRWYRSRGIDIEFIQTSDEKFRRFRFRELDYENLPLYLEQFYSEAILLAGKYPAWWLVPVEEEVNYAGFLENIQQARLIDPGEILDLGSVSGVNEAALLSQAIKIAQRIKTQSELCLIELVMLDTISRNLPGRAGIASRLKKSLYNDEHEKSLYQTVAEMMQDTFEAYPDSEHIMLPSRLISQLANSSAGLNAEIIQAFCGENYVQPVARKGVENIIAFMNLNKALLHEIRKLYVHILDRYRGQPDQADDKVLSHALNVQSSLSDSADRVPLYNSRDIDNLVLDKIQLRHDIGDDGESRWALVIRLSEAVEKTIEGFTSLVGLLAWCWLNRMINHSTQVSVECPRQQVKQTEVRHIMEVLMHQLDPLKVAMVSTSELNKPVRAVQSLIFINLTSNTTIRRQTLTENDDPLSFGEASENLMSHCEQLIINSWGDVYTRTYSGNAAIINCLCEWTHGVAPGRRNRPAGLYFSGYGAGNSTHISQRLDEVYQNIIEYFYDSREVEGRFIVCLGSDYYVVSVNAGELVANRLGDERKMFNYLEAPLSHFQSTELERLAYTAHPLKQIYKQNQADVVQVFYQLAGRHCYTWVLDEHGSLFRTMQERFERDGYILHWLYFYKNISQRLKKISYQEREVPKIEITHIVINRLGEVDFVPVSAASVTAEKHFYDVGLRISGSDEGDRLDVTLDGVEFPYEKYQQAALAECVKVLKSRIQKQGRQSIYVTDINVPLRLYNVSDREQIQFSHILRFKRSFERRIHHLVEEL